MQNKTDLLLPGSWTQSPSVRTLIASSLVITGHLPLRAARRRKGETVPNDG